MNWLENDLFVNEEVIPIIEEDIYEWIENNRYNEWFENDSEIDDFDEMEIPEDLCRNIEKHILKSIEEYGQYYNIENINYSTHLDQIILENLETEEWQKQKTEKIQEVRDILEHPIYNDYLNDEY